MFSGHEIGSSLYPNSYPAKLRYSATSTLAKQIYEFIVSNEYSLNKSLSTVEHYDSIIRDKLAEPLSDSYRKTLVYLSGVLRIQLVKKGSMSALFINSIPLKYNNNTSYNTIRRHVNIIANYLNNRVLKVKTRKLDEVLHSPINNGLEKQSIPL